MGKGQAIGGEQPRGGGMLPPSGSGPLEVTPEWLAEQERAAQQSASAGGTTGNGRLPGQKATAGETERAETPLRMPDPETSPADQLGVCERAIHAAKTQFVAKMEKASDDFVDEAGPFLEWIHEYKLYKITLDNSGKAYRSYGKYLKEQHSISASTGYRIVRTVPLQRILAAGGHHVPELSVRQVQELHPVRKQHGADAVLQVWRTASQTKKGALPTPEELAKAKTLRDLTTKPDDDDEGKPALTQMVDPGKALAQATKILVPDTVRAAVKHDPDRVRLLIQVLRTAMSEEGMATD